MAALPLPVAILDDLICGNRKWGHPRWRPEAEGPPSCATATIGIEKTALYYSQPLSGPMMAWLLTYISVTRPQYTLLLYSYWSYLFLIPWENATTDLSHVIASAAVANVLMWDVFLSFLWALPRQLEPLLIPLSKKADGCLRLSRRLKKLLY